MTNRTEWAVKYMDRDLSTRVVPLKSKDAAIRAAARGLPPQGTEHQVVSREVSDWRDFGQATNEASEEAA